MTKTSSWLICIAVLAATAVPGFARPTKIALARFDRDTGAVGAAIADVLEDGELQIVGPQKVSRAIERLGFDQATAGHHLKKLAAALEVDVVVQGALDRRHHTLQLEVYGNGRKTRPFTIEVANPRSGEFRRLARKTMLAKFNLVMPADGAAPATAGDDDVAEASAKPKHKAKASLAAEADAAPEAAPAKSKRKAKASVDAEADADADPERVVIKSDAKPDDAAAPAPKRKAKAKAKPETAPEASATADAPAAPEADAADAPVAAAPRKAKTKVAAREDEDSNDAPERDAATPQVVHTLGVDGATAHTANRLAARLDVGASAAARTLRFQSATTTNAPPSYKGVPAPGGRVGAELYPFAFGDPDSGIAGLGFGGDYDQTVGLALRTAGATGAPMKIIAHHYAAGLRYRMVLGHSAASPTITLNADYGARSFLVTRTGAMTTLDMPDTDYRLFQPGVRLWLPLGRWLAFELSGRALLARSAGPIQRPDQYGQANITAGEASAAFDIIFSDRFALRLAAEGTQLDLKFGGTGMLANNRDGDPSTIDVRRATDRYVGGSATLAVLY